MDKQRLLELAGIEIIEEADYHQQLRDLAQQIARVMADQFQQGTTWQQAHEDVIKNLATLSEQSLREMLRMSDR